MRRRAARAWMFWQDGPTKAAEHPRAEYVWFREDVQGCVCKEAIGVGGDVVLARVAAQFLDGGDEDGVGVGGRVGEGGVDLKRGVKVPDGGVVADDVFIQGTYDAGVNGGHGTVVSVKEFQVVSRTGPPEEAGG